MNYESVISFYDEKVKGLNSLFENRGQGAVRSATGKLFETLAEIIITEIDPSLKCKHNDYLTKHSKSGKYKLEKLQVDLHVYRDDELLFILESKTYLDACYLKRAVEDFREIRDIVGEVPAIIFSGQNAVGYNTYGYYNEEYDFETFYINLTKSRSSEKPLYKTRDPLDKVELEIFVDHVRSII